jgi:hypothetical protein
LLVLRSSRGSYDVEDALIPRRIVMKRWMRVTALFCAVLAVVLFASAPVLADQGGNGNGNSSGNNGNANGIDNGNGGGNGQGNNGNGNGDGGPRGNAGGGGAAPEIGLGAAAGALALLTGATLIAVDRRRRQSAPVRA